MTCAFAVRGALKKFAGVESVEVSLNKGLATVKLKSGNSLTPDEFWAAVKKNGFTPKETHVIVKGDVTASRGKPQVRVSGTSRVYELVTNARVLTADDLTRLSGKTITLEGTMTPGKDAPREIYVQKVRE